MSEEDKDLGIYTAGLSSAVRVVFPTLFEPRRVKIKGRETGDPKFSATFLFDTDHVDLAGLKATAAKVAKARWPDRKLAELHFPFQDGNVAAEKSKANKKDGSFYVDQVVLKTSSKHAPAVLDGRKTPPVMTKDTGLIYSGAWVGFEVNFTAYDGVGENPDGVTCYLNSVCFVGPGARIAGKDHAATFAGIAGRKTDENPLDAHGVSDDEIPF